MAKETFAQVMPHVFKHEGGYVDHPKDPGGATNYGITHQTLASWRGRPVTKAEVRALTKAEASKIYKARYWDRVRGDELPAGLDYAVFDFAINSGPGRAIPYMQTALAVPADGKIGPVTMQAARSKRPGVTVNKLCDARLAFLKRLSTWATFGRGWERRVDEVRSAALALTPPDVALPDPDLDMRPLPSGKGVNIGAIVGAIIAAAITAAAIFLGVK